MRPRLIVLRGARLLCTAAAVAWASLAVGCADEEPDADTVADTSDADGQETGAQGGTDADTDADTNADTDADTQDTGSSGEHPCADVDPCSDSLTVTLSGTSSFDGEWLVELEQDGAETISCMVSVSEDGFEQHEPTTCYGTTNFDGSELSFAFESTDPTPVTRVQIARDGALFAEASGPFEWETYEDECNSCVLGAVEALPVE